MLVSYDTGRLESARALLAALGFKELGSEILHLFPADRPVFVGKINHDGETFVAHVHIVAVDSYEVKRFRIFRDRLRADAALRQRYVALKRDIVASGVDNPDDYVSRKEALIAEILGDDYHH